jgi:hypothetical protein
MIFDSDIEAANQSAREAIQNVYDNARLSVRDAIWAPIRREADTDEQD